MQKSFLLFCLISVVIFTNARNYRLPLFHNTPLSPATSNFYAAEYNLALDRASEFLGPADSITRSVTISNPANVYQRALEFANSCGTTTAADIVIGTENSASASDAALIFRFYDLPILSFGASADDLSNKYLYPSFGRTVMSTGSQGVIIPAVLSLFAWRNVAVVATTDSFGSKILQNFQAVAATYGVNVVTLVTYPTGTTDAAVHAANALTLKNSGALIFVALTTSADLVGLMSAASAIGITGPTYQWVGCSGNTAALPVGSLSLAVYIDTETASFGDFKTRYVASSYNAGAPFANHPIKPLQSRVYDTTILALKSIARVQQVRVTCANAASGGGYNPAILAVNQTLAAWCTLGDNKLTYLMSRNVTFVGAANNVDLNENGDVAMGTFVLLNKRVASTVPVALIGTEGKTRFFPNEKIHWSNGKTNDNYVPRDREILNGN